MTHTTADTQPTRTRMRQAVWERPTAAVVMIVAASTVVAVLAPDMVSGSDHEHLPLAALTVWPWTAAAIAYVVMAGRGGYAGELVVSVSFVWAFVAVIAVAVPSLVTGSDPTRIPLAALIAPPFGAVTTGFLAIAYARSAAGH